MRAGLVIYGSLETVSGGYLYDRMLAGYLRGQGDVVEAVSLPWRSYPRHLLDNWSPAFWRRLRDGQWDVLLQDELNHPSLVRLNRELRRTGGHPVVAIVHHLRSSEARPQWQNRVYRAVERKYLSSVDGFIYNSETTRSAVEALAGPGKPYVVAPPGRDHRAVVVGAGAISGRAGDPGPLRVLFVGNAIPRKGLHVLLAALAALPPGDCRLTVAGSLQVDREYAAAIRRQIARDRLEGRVRLAGAVSDARLAEMYRTHHVLAVPSSYEGYGIVYAEALGCGLPAIATTAGAASEVITDGCEGYLVPPGNAAALAERLSGLAHDRGRLRAMGLAARARYEQLPTWAESGEQARAFLTGDLH